MAAKKKVTIEVDIETLKKLHQAVENSKALANALEQWIPDPAMRDEVWESAKKAAKKGGKKGAKKSAKKGAKKK